MQKGTRLFWSPWEGVELCLGTGDEPAELLGWGQSTVCVVLCWVSAADTWMMGSTSRSDYN